jgi:uncharacterized protein YjhX (UPF0386 family)
MRVAEEIELDEATERELRALAKGRRIEARLRQRARVILLAAQGWQNKDIVVEVELDRRQVALWRGASSKAASRRCGRMRRARPSAHRHFRGGAQDPRGDAAHEACGGLARWPSTSG